MAKTFSIVSECNPKFSATSVLVAAGTAQSIGVGTPTFGVDAAAASWTGAVAIGVDGNGTTAQRFTGIAKSKSTETASVAGSVDVWLPLPGIIYSGFAKTSSTADTAAEIQALFGKRVVFDLTSSNWTIDAGATDAVANCVVIYGGDATTATLSFFYRPSGTFLDYSISA